MKNNIIEEKLNPSNIFNEIESELSERNIFNYKILNDENFFNYKNKIKELNKNIENYKKQSINLSEKIDNILEENGIILNNFIDLFNIKPLKITKNNLDTLKENFDKNKINSSINKFNKEEEKNEKKIFNINLENFSEKSENSIENNRSFTDIHEDELLYQYPENSEDIINDYYNEENLNNNYLDFENKDISDENLLEELKDKEYLSYLFSNINSPIEFINKMEFIYERISTKGIKDITDLYPLETYKKKNILNVDEINYSFKNKIYEFLKEKNISCSHFASENEFYIASDDKIYQYNFNSELLMDTYLNNNNKILSIDAFKNYIVTGNENGGLNIFLDKKIIDSFVIFKKGVNCVKFIKTKPKKIVLISCDLLGNVVFIQRSKTFLLNNNFEMLYFVTNDLSVLNLVLHTPIKDLSKAKKKKMTLGLVTNEYIKILKINTKENSIEKFKENMKENTLLTIKKPNILNNLNNGIIPQICFIKGYVPKDTLLKDNNIGIDSSKININLIVCWGNVFQLYVRKEDEKFNISYIYVGYYIYNKDVININAISNSVISIIDIENNLSIIFTFNFIREEINLDKKNNNIQINFNKFKIEEEINSFLIKKNKTYDKYILSLDKSLIIFFKNNKIGLYKLKSWEEIIKNLSEKEEYEKMLWLAMTVYTDSKHLITLGNVNEKSDFKEIKGPLISQFLFQYVNKLIYKNKDNNNFNSYLSLGFRMCIEFGLNTNSINYLFPLTGIVINNNVQDIFFSSFTKYILNGDLILIDIDSLFLSEYIKFYIEKKQKILLNKILLHINVKSLCQEEIQALIINNDLINPFIYICMNPANPDISDGSNNENVDLYKPIETFMGFFLSKESNPQYKELLINHDKNLYNQEVLSCKEYFGHRILAYIDLCLEGLTYPNKTAIPKNLYEDIVKKLALFLINYQTLDTLLIFDSFSYFYVFKKLYSYENIYNIINKTDFKKEMEDFIIKINLSESIILTPKGFLYSLFEYINKLNNFFILKDLYDFISSFSKYEYINIELDNETYMSTTLFLINYVKKYKNHIKEDVFHTHSTENSIESTEKILINLFKIIEEKSPLLDEDLKKIFLISKDTPFHNLNLYILRILKNYKECFNTKLNIYKEINDKSENMKINELFDWIDETLTDLNNLEKKKSNNNEKQYFITFKEFILEQFQILVEISVDRVNLLVDKWYKEEEENVIHKLDSIPNLQFKYLEIFLENKEKNEDINVIELSFFVALKIELLLKMNRSKDILNVLKKYNFICENKNIFDILKFKKIYDSMIYIYIKNYNFKEALNLTIDQINSTYKDCVVNLIDENFDIEYIKNKIEYYKILISLGIETCIDEIKYKNDENMEQNLDFNSENNQSWLVFLNCLYEIKKQFRSLFENYNKKKKEALDLFTNIINKELENVLEKLTDYISLKSTIEEVSKNFKEYAGIKEFSNIIIRLFFNYHLIEIIYKVTKDIIYKSILNNFDLDIINRNKGINFSIDICQYCYKNIKDGGIDNIKIFPCGHCYHLRCVNFENDIAICFQCKRNELEEDINKSNKININKDEIKENDEEEVKVEEEEIKNDKKINKIKMNKLKKLKLFKFKHKELVENLIEKIKQ